MRYSGIVAAGTGGTMANTAEPTLGAGAPPRTPAATACAILTPSGAVLARGLVHVPPDADPFRPAPAGPAPAPACAGSACGLRVTQVEPPGALEALFHANQPRVVLRNAEHAQLSLRIDHITGPLGDRTYYLEPVSES